MQKNEDRTTTIHSVAKYAGRVYDTPRQSATSTRKSYTKSKNRTGVNRSLTKKQTPTLHSQIVSSTIIGISNSFDALLCEGEHAMNEAGHTEQQLEDTATPVIANT